MTSSETRLQPGGTVGLIAGMGQLPFAVAHGVRAQGYRLAVFGLKHLADEGLEGAADEFHLVDVGKLGRLIKSIEQSGARDVVFAGKVPKSLLYKMNVVPDLRAVKLLYSLPDRKDDTIMNAILAELEAEGLRVLETTAFTNDFLVKTGCMTRKSPNTSEEKDIHFGAGLAREIGRLDIGQTVVVKNRAVMAIEAIEGTDEAIRRGGSLAGGGAVVVKVAKPNQDQRFDVPVVGEGTLKAMEEGGCSVLALEAGAVIVVEREKLIERADRSGIVVVGFHDQVGVRS